MARKFRPSFTASQIKILHSLAVSAGEPTLASILSEYILKIQLGLVKHEYKASTIEQKLGMEASEDTREIAYQKYLSFPQHCTSQEELDARTFMYENDLMSPEEEATFESTIGIGTGA